MNKLILAALLALPLGQAWAARPFVTDDARLTTAGSCQLESWLRVYPDSRELWALPACNPGGNLEFTFGGGDAKNDGQQSTSDYLFQLKTLFRPLQSNDWGWGVAVGSVRHPEIKPGPNQLGNSYVYLPLSLSFNDDQLIVHGNLGWLRDRASQQDSVTWGVGAEYQVSAHLLAIAETFGDSRNRPYWHVGGRFSLVPNLVQLDATVGQQFSGPASGRWLSFGLRLTPERLF